MMIRAYVKLTTSTHVNERNAGNTLKKLQGPPPLGTRDPSTESHPCPAQKPSKLADKKGSRHSIPKNIFMLYLAVRV